MTPNIPELSILVQAARDIVTTAQRWGNLGSLTVKTVRRQVEEDFSLEEGTLDEGTTKTALRNAVHTALSEDLEVTTVEKRKRSLRDSAEREEGKPKKTKKTKEKEGTSGGEKGKATSPKKKLQARSVKSKETIVTESEDGEDTPAPVTTASTFKTKQKKSGKSKSSSFVKAEPPIAQSVHADSESELSVLIDEPRRKKKTKGKAKKSTTRKSKKEDPENAMDPGEEMIKRLKSFVSACGVRKSWPKEFADLPLPEQQVARLKEILADLGMTGRHSLEKAKAIKEKRALARELNDVVEFERKAGVSRANRGRLKANAKRIVGELDTNSEISKSDSEDEDSSTGKKNTASKSIMEYLANQSSDED